MSLPIIKAVLWDLDGAHQTSHGDEQGANYQADRHTIATLFPGIDISVADTWPFVGQHHSVYRSGMIEVGYAKANHGKKPDKEEAAALLKAFGEVKTQFFADHPEVLQPRPGVVAWAQFFHENGTFQAMASHSPRAKVHHALKQIGTFDLFQEAYSTDDFGCLHKPDPTVWLETLKKIAPAVTPVECLVIDDSDANIAGAMKAGFNCVHCPDIPRQAESDNAITLKRLFEATGRGLVMERNGAFDLERLRRFFTFVPTLQNTL